MQSRVMLNVVDEPSKFFSIDRTLNRLMQLAAVVNVCVVLASVAGYLAATTEDDDDDDAGEPCIEGFPPWLGKLFTYQTCVAASFSPRCCLFVVVVVCCCCCC